MCIDFNKSLMRICHYRSFDDESGNADEEGETKIMSVIIICGSSVIKVIQQGCPSQALFCHFLLSPEPSGFLFCQILALHSSSPQK